MKTKLPWLGFLSLFSCFVHAQTVINTNHPNNNGNGSVTFEVQNTNAYDIVIIGAQCHLGTTPTNNIQLLYNTSPDVDTAPPWSFGVVGAGQNGWISAGTGVVSNSNTANGIVSVLSNLSLTVPAGATYQLGLSATTMQYSTLTTGAGINTFSAGGVNLFTGDGISWGGVSYPSTPANYPRGIIGGITFVPAIHFVVSAPATATAGTAFNFTVTAKDASDNVVTGYTGTVHFTSTDGAAALPADSTLINGTGTFSATLKTTGSQTISATDTLTTANTGTSAPIDVGAAAATHFLASTPANATAGAAFTFAVTALDQFDNTDAAYAGTVHFTSTDGAAVLPSDSTLINGTGTFSATLKTAGSQTISATDTLIAATTGTSAPINVSAGAAAHFAVSAPAFVKAGTAFAFTVTAQDQNNNTAVGYAGTVHFTSSDVNAALPADSTLTNGVGTFSATLATAGNQTITATDTSAPSITGSSAAIAVRGNTTTIIKSLTPPGPITLGSSVIVTVSVTSATSGIGAPTGSVTVSDGSGDTCMIVYPSTDHCTLQPTAIGGKSVTASYVSDNSFLPSTSGATPLSVTPPSYLVSASSNGSGAITPASQYVADGNSASMTLAPSQGYAAAAFGGDCPSGTLSGNIYITGAISADCNVSVTFALATLKLTVTDNHAYAQYGSEVNYEITLGNTTGTDVNGVSISATGPSGLDLASGRWECFGEHCTPSGVGPFTDAGVTVPANGNVTWLVTIPVLENAPGTTIDYVVSVTGAGVIAPQTDSDTLVLFHGGFNVPYADGAQ